MTNVASIINRKGRDVVTITPAATLSRAASLLSEHRIGAVVVSRDGAQVDGILSERDIVRRFAETDGVGTGSVAVSAAMTTEVRTATLETSIDELVQVMTEGRFRHVPITQDGRLIGIVSIGDVVKSRMDELEIAKESLQEYVTGGY